MNDYMIRGTAANGEIRFFAANTKEIVEYARSANGLSPIATAALGRLMTGTAMMGDMMKSDDDLITVKIDCQGPIEGLAATADHKGHIKGYVKNPLVDLPSKNPGKLNVGGALDLGVLSVIRDTGLKDPYVGQTILQTGEIGDDLTYYFATSEQTPSSVALGVLLNLDGTVKCAGGFILQLLPNATDETVGVLEERLSKIQSVTAFLDNGMTVEEIIFSILDGTNPEILDKTPIEFRCDCSRENTRGIIKSLPKDEIQAMIDEEEQIEVICHYCGKGYRFTREELKQILAEKE